MWLVFRQWVFNYFKWAELLGNPGITKNDTRELGKFCLTLFFVITSTAALKID